VLEAADGVDALLVTTEWPEYASLDWPAIAATMRGDLVYDTRSIVAVEAATTAGLRVERLGRGSAAPQPARSARSSS
jgi:UDPglucose 6-dehydrogenase